MRLPRALRSLATAPLLAALLATAALQTATPAATLASDDLITVAGETSNEAVTNTSAAVSTTGWSAASGAGTVTVARDADVNSPGSDTGFRLTRAGGTGTWGYALATLRDPATFFQVGQSYKMQLRVRDNRASAQSIGILLANHQYGSRPTVASAYDKYADNTWHLLSRTFVADKAGAADTKLYIALPTSGALDVTVTDASVTAVATSPGTGGTPTAAAPSGEPMPVGNLTGWNQVFTDDFTTPVPLGSFPSAVSTKWGAYSNGWKDTSGNGTYMPSKVISVDNGMMNMNLRTENGQSLVAAPYPRIPGATSANGMKYGKYSVRFRADNLPGYKVAWLLWPDSDSWSQGEIDFPEGNLNSKMAGYMHFKGDPTQQHVFETGVGFTNWHTASLEWTPTSVNFILDGDVIGRSTNPAVIPSDPMHWVLQTETALVGGAPSITTRGNVQVDWVAVYSRVA